MTFKDVNLPRTDTTESTRAIPAKIDEAGIKIIVGGTITINNDAAQIKKDFENSKTEYVDDLPPIESERNEPRQELFDIEAEVIAELWDEVMREPVLKAYDEKLAEALER